MDEFKVSLKDENGNVITDLETIYKVGRTLQHEENFFDAVGVFMEGALLASTQGEEYWQMVMEIFEGGCWGMLEEPNNALISFYHAKELAEKRNDLSVLFPALLGIGKMHAYLNEDQEALDTLDECARLMKETGKTSELPYVGQLIHQIRAKSKSHRK